MNQIKAFIFDLDGVLVDTAKYHFLAWKKLANTLNFDFTEHQNEQLKGISRIDSLKLILDWANLTFNNEVIHTLASQKNSWYVEMISKMTADEILPGVVKILNEAKNNNIKVALGSASKNASLILIRTGLNEYFDVIVDGNLVNKSKPNPEVFLKAAELLNLHPSQCLVFEDAFAGVEAALNANMSVVGIGDKAILHNANMIISDFSDLSLFELEKSIEKNIVTT